MKLLQRRALIGLFAGACALAFPAAAAASINPTLVLTPGGPAGATGQTLTYSLSFKNQSPSTDSPASITTVFPAGLLADSTIDNDQCLATKAALPACQIGSGTVTLNPGGTAPAAQYLVQAPNAADVAGVLLQIETAPNTWQTVGTADVTVRGPKPVAGPPNDAGLDVSFSNLPGPANGNPQLTALNFQLTDLRLPSSCAGEQMTVDTVSESGTNESASAPFQSTGCPAQSYSPQVAAQVTAFGQPGPADVSASISQANGQAASKSIVLDLPSSLQPNLTADAGCLLGTPCQIGTASAITPLAPAAALANGTVTLGLVNNAPTITVSFPAPYQLSFNGVIDTANNTVTVQGIPDVPLTSLSLNITKSAAGTAFLTTCAPSNVGANFTGQGGQSSNVSVPISYANCTSPVGSPTAAGSLSGLSKGKPVLHLHVVHGTNAPDLSRVSIRLGHGLRFSSSGLVRRCTGHGHHRKCKIVGKGLTVNGAALKKIRLVGGTLVLTFKHAVGAVTLTIRGPLLAESKGLQKKAKHRRAKKLPVTIKVTDAKGNKTTVTLHLKA